MAQHLGIYFERTIMKSYFYDTKSVLEKELAPVWAGLVRPQWEESMPQCTELLEGLWPKVSGSRGENWEGHLALTPCHIEKYKEEKET